MKVVILAGGKGTRGKPYTDFFPKAMIPIKGRPLIHYIIKYLNSFDLISEIIVIADFNGIGGQIKNYLNNFSSKKKITFVQDSQSGTGGDLVHLESKLKGESSFFLWFVDNFCAIDLQKMRKIFAKKNSLACIATRTQRKEETGFAVINEDVITKFVEKPVVDLPMAECLGVYLLGKEVISQIKSKSKKEVNLSFDILEDLSHKGKVSAYDIKDRLWLDVESPVIVERNSAIVKKIIKQMGF